MWFQLVSIAPPTRRRKVLAAGAKTQFKPRSLKGQTGVAVLCRGPLWPDSALPESSVFDLSAPPHKFTTRVERSRRTVAGKREKTNPRGMGEERERERSRLADLQ